MRKKITEELKQDIIDFYRESPKSLDTVAEKFDLCLPTIIKILKNEPKYTKARIYNPNMVEDYFCSIDTEIKAYFLGLIIADGNVFIKGKQNRQASISITLDEEDKYILDKFKEELNINTSVASDGRGCYQIAIRSNLMASDLSKYGIVPNKSFITYLPTVGINDNLMPHLIRGIMDGDGNIFMKKTDKKFLHAISFCGSNKLMSDISDYLYNKLLLKTKPKVYNYLNRKLSEIKIQGKEDILKYGNWIYNNSSIFLLRKKKIYDQFIEYYSYNKILDIENPEVISGIAKGSDTP